MTEKLTLLTLVLVTLPVSVTAELPKVRLSKSKMAAIATAGSVTVRVGLITREYFYDGPPLSRTQDLEDYVEQEQKKRLSLRKTNDRIRESTLTKLTEYLDTHTGWGVKSKRPGTVLSLRFSVEVAKRRRLTGERFYSVRTDASLLEPATSASGNHGHAVLIKTHSAGEVPRDDPVETEAAEHVDRLLELVCEHYRRSVDSALTQTHVDWFERSIPVKGCCRSSSAGRP